MRKLIEKVVGPITRKAFFTISGKTVYVIKNKHNNVYSYMVDSKEKVASVIRYTPSGFQPYFFYKEIDDPKEMIKVLRPYERTLTDKEVDVIFAEHRKIDY